MIEKPVRTRKCKRCGKIFTPTHSNQQVCDNAHYKKCANCGKDYPWEKRGKTCSGKCAAALRSKSLPKKKCEYCGDLFQPNAPSDSFCKKEHHKKCENCGKDFVIKDVRRVSRACSPSCAAALSHTEASDEKRRENSLRKYGTEFVTQSAEVKKKIRESQNQSEKDTRIGSELFKKVVKEKYGVDNASSCSEIKEKKKKRSIENFGVDNPMRNERIKEKQIESTVKKYGKTPILLAREQLEAQYNVKSPALLHINHLKDWENIEHWAREEQLRTGDLLKVDETSAYFNVNRAVLLKARNKFNLYKFFEKDGKSLKEQQFEEWLNKNFPNVSYQRNTRSVISPKELDFYFPEYNFAVEISPTTTHHSSEKSCHGWEKSKNVSYHQEKMLECEKKNIELITVFDWIPWDKVLSMISYKFLNPERRIFARKTVSHFIDKNQNKKEYKLLKDFVEKFHILGFDGRGTKYFVYLTFEDEIVAVSSWGHPRMLNRHAKKDSNIQRMELMRMCFKDGVSVIGGASKMLKHFISECPDDFNEIITFSDCDLGSGNIYKTLGFNLFEQSKPVKNYVHPYMMNNGVNWRIKASSLHLAGTDRLLKNFPSYTHVGTVCTCTNVHHENGECLPSNEAIVGKYGFLPVFDCGYKKWILKVH